MYPTLFSIIMGGDQMERKYFNSLSHIELVKQIVSAVQAAAAEVPKFADSHNGCIEVLMIPLNKEVDDWLGGASICDAGGRIIEANEYGFTRKIHPQGTHTIEVTCKDGHVEPVNCFGYVHLKIAYAARKRALTAAGRAEELKKDAESGLYVEENGYSMDKGIVGLTVFIRGRDWKESLLRIWVGVSGASEEEDYACAMVGVQTAETILGEYSNRLFHFEISI